MSSSFLLPSNRPKTSERTHGDSSTPDEPSQRDRFRPHSDDLGSLSNDNTQGEHNDGGEQVRVPSEIHGRPVDDGERLLDDDGVAGSSSRREDSEEDTETVGERGEGQRSELRASSSRAGSEDGENSPADSRSSVSTTHSIPSDSDEESESDHSATDDGHLGRRRRLKDEGEEDGKGKDETSGDLIAAETKKASA